MYETITYQELKELPEDKKAEAWKELHSEYPDNRVLAQKLGVATIAVVNGIKKYVLGEPVGRASKMSKELQTPTDGQENRPKRKYNKKAKAGAEGRSAAGAENAASGAQAGIDNSFSISINKTVTGENAQFLFNGIGNTLIKNQEYIIEIKIIEK